MLLYCIICWLIGIGFVIGTAKECLDKNEKIAWYDPLIFLLIIIVTPLAIPIIAGLGLCKMAQEDE